MRVLILTPDIYTRGGIARYTATLASGFGELIGAENVHVLPYLGTAASGETFGKLQVLSPVTHHLSTPSKFRFAAKAVGAGWSRYSMVVCTHIGLSPVAALLRLLFGTRFWAVCHGGEAWRRFPADVRWALGQADLILPVSFFTAKTVSEVNAVPPAKIRVLYNAISDDFTAMLTLSNGAKSFGTQSTGTRKHILSVGKVAKEFAYKGYDTVIRALPEVLQIIPEARYLIVGEGDDINRLKGLASNVGVQNHVEFKGGIPDADLASCYRACDVFVLPSRARTDQCWEGEGFGRVYVEAALAGKPVVGSTDGGAAEAVLHQKTGLLVNPTSVSDVADALIKLLKDPDLAATMGGEGRRWALENFTASALRRQLGDILGSAEASFPN